MSTPGVTLVGKLTDIAGNPDPGQVIITLANYGGNIPVIAGTDVLAPLSLIVQAAADGTFSTELWGNYQITPGSTYYTIGIEPSDGTGPVSIGAYLLNSAGDFDLSVLTPLTAITPSSPFATSQVGTVDWANVTNKPLTFPPNATAELIAHKGQPNGYASLDSTGGLSVGTTLQLGSISGYADLGAAITAKLASLPTSGGTIDARGISGAQTLSSVSIPSNTTILLPDASQATLTVPSDATGFMVTGKSHVRIYGGSLAIAGLHSYGVLVNGTSVDVEVRGMTITGDSTPASYQYALIATDTATNIRFIGNTVSSIGGVGIACGTSKSDTIRNCIIRDNRISAVYGTGTGQGYGVLVNSSAPSATLVTGNYIEKTQRHCAYLAEGGGVRFVANHMADHGYGLAGNIATGGCISAGRGSNIIISKNLIERSGNNAIEVFPGTLSSGDSVTRNIDIEGNIITDTDPSQGDISSLYASPDDVVNGLHIRGNIIARAASHAGISAISVLSGKQVQIAGNTIAIPTAAGYGISVTAGGESAGTANYTSGVAVINNNVFTGGGSDVGIYLSDTFAASTIDLSLANNTIKSATPLYISGTQTNPNISSWQSPLGNLSLSLLKPYSVGSLAVGKDVASYPLDVAGGARIEPTLTISGSANPYILFDDGTALHYLQISSGGFDFYSPKAVHFGGGLDAGSAGISNAGAVSGVSSFALGNSSTSLTRYAKYTATLSPLTVAANTCVAQTHTVNGIQASDIIIKVQKPTEQAGLSVVGARPTGANTIVLQLCNNTASSITPKASELYTFIVVQ